MHIHSLHYPHLSFEAEREPTVVAIGVFDGVHAGHRRLLERTKALAASLGAAPAVFTFVEHPRSVLRTDHAVPLLTPWPEKLARLSDMGLAHCFGAHFTPDLAALSPRDFVARLLVGELGAKAVVTGFNFAFGKDQAGTPETLRALGAELGFRVETVAPIATEDGAVVSSSRVRTLLATGAVAEANALLGAPYALVGPVVHGDKRGRTIGFPTANVEVPREKLLPAYGVYACWVVLPDGSRHAGVVNIGQRPTFDPPQLRIEAHLFDFEGDLYGQTIAVELAFRLRGEQAFPGIDALVAQIRADCERARALLAAPVA